MSRRRLPALLLALAPATQAATLSPGDIGEAMATGDCPTVIANLPAPTTDPQRLAFAKCALRLGNVDGALAAATAIRGELRPYAALTRAEALLARGETSEAAAALVGVTLPGSEDELLRGAVLLQSGDAAGAVAVYTALTGNGGAPAAWSGLARAKEAARDKAGAVAAWRKVWTNFPTATESVAAEAALLRLGSPVPDASTEEGRGVLSARADRLLALSQADRAIPLLDAQHAVVPFAEVAQRKKMADALFAAKLYARAVEWYGPLNREAPSPASMFAEALATARSGDSPGAVAKYAALAARFPTSPQADEAAWKPGYMDYDAGRLPLAIQGFTAYLAARPTGKFAVDARWFRAWSHAKLGNREEALAGFDTLVASFPTSDLAVAAAYWRARLRNDDAGLRAVVEKSPETGYAWFAAERLGIHFPAVTDPPAPTLPDTFLEAHPKTALAVLLLDAGLPSLARPLLPGDVEAARTGGEATAVPMAHALVRAELYKEAMKLASPWCAKAAARGACHPRPYARTLATITAPGGLDPLLPYAIMNAESGLDRGVVSPAGAIGLMQLMPALAIGLAQGRVAGFAEDDLYGAGVNARLGTSELTELRAELSELNLSLPATIAAYNGGAAVVRRWAATYAEPPEPDRFAEDISYTETRRYVRRVLGYLMRYRRVYGG